MTAAGMSGAGASLKHLRIEAAAHAALLRHLLSDPHRETCGVLSGRDGTALHFHPVPNVSPTPEQRYEMDPGAQIQAFRRMRETGERLLAIAHSHPHGEAWPSTADIAEATYPEAVYVIASLRGAEPELRGFWLQPGQEPRPVHLEVAPSTCSD